MKQKFILIMFIGLVMGVSFLFAVNNSLVFDGVNDYINLPTEPLYTGSDITSFTQEAWIYSRNTDESYHAVMGSQVTGDAVNRGPSIYIYNTNTIHFGFGDGSTWHAHDIENVIEANTWTHLAVSFDGTNYSLYVNGILKYTGTDDAGSYPVRGITTIGKVDNYFNGKIDEVRIWNDARTETEIRQNMYQELPDPASESNLVAYYKFNETSGTTLSDSKGSHTGTLTNMSGNEWTATSSMLVSKKCLNFDGSNDYVSLPSSLYSDNLSGGSAITIEYWFKGASLQSPVRFQNGAYIVPGWGEPRQFIISSDGGTSGVTIGSSDEIEDGNWHHIACVWEANTTNGFRTYLDGVLKNQRTSANVTLPTINSGAWLGSLQGTTEFLTGSLDEVRIWNTARTGTQIREDMTRTLEGGESGLIAYYSLNEAGGLTAYDATNKSNNGTINGATWTDSESFTTWLGVTSNDWSTASNWTNGVPTSSSNVGIYTGTDYNEATISGTPEVNNLVISSTSTPTLSSGITVNGSFILEKNMNLNGQTVTLGPSATLIEDAGVFSGTSGSITTTRTLSNIDEDVAGLGATITTSANMGSTTITRTHTSVSGNNFKSSILRQYAITPNTNTGLNATLEFNYDDSELNSLKEMTLQLVKSTDGGSTWSEQGGVVSTANNTVTLSRIDGFSTWGVTQLTQAMNNYALDFDGENDYVECGNDASITQFNNFTLEAWVKLENANTDQKIVGKFKNSSFNDFYVMGVRSGEYHFEIATGNYDNRLTFSAGNVPNNTWTHLAVTFSKGNGGANGTFYGYVNGELVYSKTDVADAAISVSDASYPLRIGVAPWDINDFKVDGQIDEVRIWNTSRTASEIRENMCRTLDGDEGGLVAYYRLNETSGTTAYDATDNANNGTLINMDGSSDWVDSEAFTTWLGGTSNAWSSASNWTDGVPTSTDNVGIYTWTDYNEATISGTPEVNNLLISSTSTPTLSSGITVNGNLLLEKNMDLNGQTITLGSSATLVEDAGVFSGTSGSITTTRTLSNIDEDVAGLGATITTSANMGSTTITRSHASVSGYNFKSSVLLQFAITPSTNTGLDANLKFSYLDSEINSLEETKLQFVKSTDGGTSWIDQGGIVSTGDNTITLLGVDGFSTWGVTQLIQPMNNYALDFDGTDDEISTNYTTQLNSWTVECWVKGDNAPTTSGSSLVVYRAENFQLNWDHGDVNYKGTIALQVGGSWYGASFGTLEADIWYHLVGTYDGENLKAYKNGQLITDNGLPFGNPTATNHQLMLGSTGSGQYFDGQIDEIRIWNDVRTAQEIRENMCRTLDGDEDGLVAYYRLNETKGTTAYDGTGNNYNGTIAGNAVWTDSEAFTTWLGGTNNAWSSAYNWTDGVPTSTDNVGIYKWHNHNETILSGSPTVNNLIISSASNPTLSSGITVNGNLLLEKNMDLNGQTITLGSSATLVEDAGVFSGTSGSITTTRSLSNIDEDVAGLGAAITEDGDLGSTTIIRGHAPQGDQGIKRYYQITTTNRPSLATLVFHYNDSELNSLTESNLKLFKSSDGSNWTEQSSTVDTDENTITMTGINIFSYWTAAESGETALPVTLIDFVAIANKGTIELSWTSESETENLGFILEKRIKGSSSWEALADYMNDETLAGNGTSNETHHYSFVDSDVMPGLSYEYQLSDVDFSGHICALEIIEMANPEYNTALTRFALNEAYPNPFNPSVTIRMDFGLQSNSIVNIYNAQGLLVDQIYNGIMDAGQHELVWNASNMPSGVYIVQLIANDFVDSKKMVLMK